MIQLYTCVCVCQLLSCVWLFATPWLESARLLCPWNSPGKKTGVGYHSLFQQKDSLLHEPSGKPFIYYLVIYILYIYIFFFRFFSIIGYYKALNIVGLPLVAQRVKRLRTMWETRVQSLGWEDPLEKEMATHSSTLAWKISWTEKPGRLQSMGSQRVGHDWVTSLSLLSCSMAGRSFLFVCFMYSSEYLLISNSYFIPPPGIHCKQALVQHNFLSNKSGNGLRGGKNQIILTIESFI